MANQRSPPYVDLQVGSGTTDAGGDVSISFTRAFSNIPKVFLQGIDSGAKGIVLDVVSRSASGFVAKARKVTGITSGSGGPNHSHGFSVTTGGPSATTHVARSDHTHGFTTGTHNSSTNSGRLPYTLSGWYCAHDSGGPTDDYFLATTAARTTQSYLYGSHTHGGTTGTPSVSVYVASSTHTHSDSGTTGGASAYSHQHSVAAPVLSISFDYFAVLA